MNAPKEKRLSTLPHGEPKFVPLEEKYRSCRNRQPYSEVGLIPVGQGSPTATATSDKRLSAVGRPSVSAKANQPQQQLTKKVAWAYFPKAYGQGVSK
jgi:hypothetical protein